MSLATTPSPSGLPSDSLRDPPRSAALSPPRVPAILANSDYSIPARPGMQSEARSRTYVLEPGKISFPVLSSEAIHEVGGRSENTDNESQREAPSHISNYSGSRAPTSEPEALAFPLRAVHLSEPTPKARNLSSNPITPNEGASAGKCFPSQSRSRVTGFSQNNPSNITRCPPLLDSLIPPKVGVNSAAATTTNQSSLSRPVPAPSIHRRSKSTASQDPHINEPAHISSATLSCEIPDPTKSKTPVKPRICRNISTTSLENSPRPINSEFRQISVTANWARTGPKRMSTGSGPPPSFVHFPSRSRAGSYGESDNEALKARERRWGSGLPVPRPPSSRGSGESSITSKRTYSLDRPSSECGYARIPRDTNRRSSVSNLLSSSVRSSSCSRSRAASGGESDIEILKERERGWGSGLPIPKPPTPGNSENTTKRRLSLECRSVQNGIEHPLSEPIGKADTKLNWAAKTPHVEPVSKREIGDGSLTILNPSALNATFQQHPISAIAESPNISLHSAWVNSTPFGPAASPLTASVIASVGPLVEADPDISSPDGSLASPSLSFHGEHGRITGGAFLNAAIDINNIDISNDPPRLPSADLNEMATTSPVTITREMSIPEVLGHLSRHGCNDVTSQLDISKSSEHPVSSGGFGDVYRGACHDGSQVAIKCLRLHVDSTDITKTLLKRAARELYVWSKCSHSNVLTLIGVAQYRSQIAMVSPWMEYNNLNRLVSKHPKVDRYILCLQIADGVAHLHKEGVVHGDLKGDNILFADNFTPKLTDFGNAALKEYTLKFSRTTGVTGVSLNWAAPEVLREETELTFESDTWSLGMTMLEVVTGAIPYAELRSFIVLKRLVSHVLPVRPEEHVPSQVKHADLMWSLLAECWAKEPGNRPSPIEVRNRMSDIISERDTADRRA